MLDNPKTDQKTRDFLKEKLKRAKDLIEDFSKEVKLWERSSEK